MKDLIKKIHIKFTFIAMLWHGQWASYTKHQNLNDVVAFQPQYFLTTYTTFMQHEFLASSLAYEHAHKCLPSWLHWDIAILTGTSETAYKTHHISKYSWLIGIIFIFMCISPLPTLICIRLPPHLNQGDMNPAQSWGWSTIHIQEEFSLTNYQRISICSSLSCTSKLSTMYV